MTIDNIKTLARGIYGDIMESAESEAFLMFVSEVGSLNQLVGDTTGGWNALSFDSAKPIPSDSQIAHLRANVYGTKGYVVWRSRGQHRLMITSLANADDTNSRLLSRKNFKGKTIKVGINNQADYQATHSAYSKGGMTFQVKLDGKACNFFIPIYGKHNVYNALFAIAVAHTLGFSPEKISDGLKSYQQPYRRLRLYRLNNDITLIDDTFNANPNSVKAALDVLTSISQDNNVAVLGSMAELGRCSKKGHINVGRYAARKNNLSRIYTYGKDAQQIARSAVKSGFSQYRIVQTIHRKNLHKHLKRDIQPGSTILVKGSHSMGMNKTVMFLKTWYS